MNVGLRVAAPSAATVSFACLGGRD